MIEFVRFLWGVGASKVCRLKGILFLLKRVFSSSLCPIDLLQFSRTCSTVLFVLQKSHATGPFAKNFGTFTRSRLRLSNCLLSEILVSNRGVIWESFGKTQNSGIKSSFGVLSDTLGQTAKYSTNSTETRAKRMGHVLKIYCSTWPTLIYNI